MAALATAQPSDVTEFEVEVENEDEEEEDDDWPSSEEEVGEVVEKPVESQKQQEQPEQLEMTLEEKNALPRVQFTPSTFAHEAKEDAKEDVRLESEVPQVKQQDDLRRSASFGIMALEGSGKDPFFRLLMELAAEHRRAISQLQPHRERKFPSEKSDFPKRRESFPRETSPAERPASLDDGACPPTPGAWSPKSSFRSAALHESSPGQSRVTTPRAAQLNMEYKPIEGRVSPFDFTSESSVVSKEGLGKATREFLQLRSEARKVLTSLTWKKFWLTAKSKEALDTVSAFAILLSSIQSGWIADWSVNHALQGGTMDQLPPVARSITWGFAVWFLTELLLRAWLAGFQRFMLGKEWAWNLFDVVVVSSDWSLKLMEWLTGEMQTSSTTQNLRMIRILRVLRLSRALKIFRMVKIFREIRMMVLSVLHSGYSLIWSCVLLGITMYSFSIYFVSVAAHQFEAVSPDFESEESYAELRQMFGSIPAGVYTLYLCVSGGLSWGEVSRRLIEINVLHGLIFCFYIFFTTFAVLNIITGIFVENSINSARNSAEEVAQERLQATAGLVNEIKSLFDTADQDGSGRLSLNEFEVFLNRREVRAYLDALGIETDKAKGLFQLLDLDGSGEITVDEFTFGCIRLKGYAKSVDLASLTNQIKRMADQWRHFFRWSEAQIRHFHAVESRLEKKIAAACGDMR